MLKSDEQELWEIDYEKKIGLNISDINFVKNNVSNYVGTIEDFLVSLKSIFMKMVHFLLVPIIKVVEIVHLDNFAN